MESNIYLRQKKRIKTPEAFPLSTNTQQIQQPKSETTVQQVVRTGDMETSVTRVIYDNQSFLNDEISKMILYGAAAKQKPVDNRTRDEILRTKRPSIIKLF